MGVSSRFSTQPFVAAAFVLFGAIGCWSGKGLDRLPTKYAVTIPGGEFRSNKPLSKEHNLVRELSSLGRQIRHVLELPEQNRDVEVYLFDSQDHYESYLFKEYPQLPPRRAYFVGSPKSLGVYSYWGPRTREDLRHEFTHGLLHACLEDVPLWLDEGFAEYFEVPGAIPGKPNEEYVHRLAASLADGWEPSLKELEAVKEFSKLSYFQYQQSWAWVHFLLHSNPQNRGVLVEYVRDLRANANPVPLSERVQKKIPNAQLKLAEYIRGLHKEISVSLAGQ